MMAMTLVVDMLCLALGIVGSCEVLLRSPISCHVSRIARSIGVAMSRLRSDSGSDHWKARAARRCAAIVMSSTLVLFGALIGALAPIAAMLWLVASSLDAMLALALRPDLAIVLTAVAAGYVLCRTRKRAHG